MNAQFEVIAFVVQVFCVQITCVLCPWFVLAMIVF